MRIALGVEYQGGAYKGWQRQKNAPSVQAHIEDALSDILCHDVKVTCAGRTDSGVSATGQVIHFDTEIDRPEKAYTRGVNTLVPNDIAITWAMPISDDFHARFSAIERRYRYVIYNADYRPGILESGLTHVYQPLDAKLMNEAAQAIVGKHDFTSFRATHCQANSPIREIKNISVVQTGRYIMLDVRANAFLHHMVRNIMGSLLLIGQKLEPVSWMAHLLQLTDRTQAAAKAKPNGLYLVKVKYPDRFELPDIPIGPIFWD